MAIKWFQSNRRIVSDDAVIYKTGQVGLPTNVTKLFKSGYVLVGYDACSHQLILKETEARTRGARKISIATSTPRNTIAIQAPLRHFGLMPKTTSHFPFCITDKQVCIDVSELDSGKNET